MEIARAACHIRGALCHFFASRRSRLTPRRDRAASSDVIRPLWQVALGGARSSTSPTSSPIVARLCDSIARSCAIRATRRHWGPAEDFDRAADDSGSMIWCAILDGAVPAVCSPPPPAPTPLLEGAGPEPVPAPRARGFVSIHGPCGEVGSVSSACMGAAGAPSFARVLFGLDLSRAGRDPPLTIGAPRSRPAAGAHRRGRAFAFVTGNRRAAGWAHDWTASIMGQSRASSFLIPHFRPRAAAAARGADRSRGPARVRAPRRRAASTSRSRPGDIARQSGQGACPAATSRRSSSASG